MAQYLPPYGEVLELKAWLKERGLPYVHFHDACGYSWFEFDEAGDGAREAVRAFWGSRGMSVSFQEDDLSFIVVENN